MTYVSRKALCTCGHDYDNHDDDSEECKICANGFCPHGYDESREKLVVKLLLPTELEYAELVAAIKKFTVTEECYLE
mgnify:CR=1 FL=1